jgi:type IV pilus assembly protein PilC
VISRLFAWLADRPGAIRSAAIRSAAWTVRKFWDFVAWVKDLPRRSKAFVIATAIAFKDLLIAIGAWMVATAVAVYDRITAFFVQKTAPLVQFARKNIDRDPATIHPSRLTIKNRGRTIAIYSRQLASMTQGGVPLLQSLDVLAEQSDDRNMGYVSSSLASRLGQGFSLSKATSEYPKIFPPVYFHLLRAGEETGRLVEVILRLADLLEKEEHLIRRVKSALSYPVFVMVLTFFLTLGLFSTVLPGFADFYADFKVPLPAVTAFLMMVTRWVQTPWFWIALVVAIVGGVKLIKYGWSVLEYRLVMYQALLWLPLAGPILKFSSLARLCWVMELTQEAGMDIMRATKLGCLASGNPLIEVDSNRITKGITQGESLSDLMAERPEIHPHLLQQLVMMGEETSRTSEAFGRAAGWFQDEVETKIENFQAALEPILMGLVSVVVGTIVLAVFLPLYGLLDKLGV